VGEREVIAPIGETDDEGQPPETPDPTDATDATDAFQAEIEAPPAPPQMETIWKLAQLPEIQGALVSLDPQTGAVLALEGGFDFGMNQYNHALQAARQPGSGFKPFVYSAALNHGVTPASIFMDAPLVFNDQNLESQYRPDNDNNRYNGPTRLREALYRSINLVSMRVLLEVGAGNVMDYVSNFGFDTQTFPRNTQLAIGGGTMAVTPLDMANAYAVFANGGWQVQPHIVQRVVDLEGQTVFEARHPVVCDRCDEPEPVDLTGEPANLEDLFADDDPLLPAPRVIDERNAYIMHNMLQDVIRRGTGTRARSLERSDIAGKTGTTNDAADTWFNGYNAHVATTVWVGFPNHQPLGKREYGSNTPLPIWIEYMEKALAGKPENVPSQPSGVVTMKIDRESGELATAQQSDAIFELFLSEHTPRAPQTATITEQEPDAEEIKAVDIF
jgi:penicillin-binding protein 1A